MKILILIIILLLTFNLKTYSQSTEGRRFWVGFMENYVDTIPISTRIIISSKNETNGLIKVSDDWQISFSVKKDSTFSITIPTNISMSIGNAVKGNKGIFVESENDINVFALNYHKHSADAAMILPIEALGYEYYCVGYYGVGSGPTEMLIIGTEDSTQIEISPKAPTTSGINYNFSIILNKGQSYQLQFNGDLTGTKVISKNNPIAVFSGAICANVPTNVPACDHLYEQLLPTSSWGRKYGIIPLRTRKGDTYKIVAHEDNTTININGQRVAILNDRESYETIIDKASFVVADKPIMVTQFSNGQNYDRANSDPFMIILSAVEQTRNNVTFNAFSSTVIENYYLNIMIKSNDLHTLTLDGSKACQQSFRSFDYDDDYKFAQLLISQGDHNITSKGNGFIAYVYGYGNYESYGYNAGTRAEKINEFKFRIGLHAYYGYLHEKLNFMNFKDVPICYRNKFEICDENNFQISQAHNVGLQALIEIPSLLTTPFGIGVRGGGSYSLIDFKKTEFAFKGTALERELKNEAKLQMLSFNVSPYLIFTFWDNLNLYTGVNWTFNSYSKINYQETITKSRISKEQGTVIYSNNNDIYDKNYQILGGMLGLGLDFVLNENRSVRLCPEVFYYYNILSNTDQFSHYMHKLTLGLSLKWGY